MRSIAFFAFLAVGVFAVSGAVAQTDPIQEQQYVAVGTAKIEKATKLRFPRPVLPDIKALTKQLWEADREKLRPQLVASRHVLAFWENRGNWLRAPRHEKCWEVPWQRSCTIARASYRLHSALAQVAETRLNREIPFTNDWRTAVRLTQRIFPGTEQWLLFISAREGGYGRFVMNHQGSGAGGWMQFMSGTFYGYVDAARAAAARQGFIVPPEVWSWTHPLGQALTAGYMKWSHQEGCHWCL